MKKHLLCTGFLLFSVAVCSIARAALLGVSVTPPVIVYASSGSLTTSYNSGSQIFTVTTTPSTIKFTPTEPTFSILTPRSMQIRVQVDNTGALVGGVSGPDLVISGRVARIVGGVTNIYSGLLLTGEVTAFGYLDVGTTADNYDFRFTPTGGLLLPFFQCDHIGVTLVSEVSTFTGLFTTNFNGQSKGNVGLEDQTPPSITCPFDSFSVTNVQCSAPGGQAGAYVTFPNPIASDNCDTNVLITCAPTNGSFFALAPGTNMTSTLVTCIAKDASGNTNSCSFTITVVDNLPPDFNSNPVLDPCALTPLVLSTDSGSCAAALTFPKPTAMDSCCTSSVPVSVSAIDENGFIIPLTEFTSNSVVFMTGEFPQTCTRSNVITSTANDGRGNSTNEECFLYVFDNEPPTLTCPSNQTVSCTNAPIFYTDPVASDNCTNLTLSCTPTNGSFLGIGSYTVTCTAIDGCGRNTNACSFTLNVADLTPPTISCPTNLTVECGQSTDPSSTGSATATDDCDGNPTVAYSDVVAGTCPVIITRTWIAADHSGNTNQCVQTITVTDSTAPTVTVPSGSDLGCNPANLPTVASVSALITVSDTCSVTATNVTYIVATNSCTVTRTFTVTASDGCNTSAPKTVVYTWTADTTAPTVTVPTGSNLGCNPGTLPTDASVKALVSATDTCSTPVVNVSHTDATSGCVVTRTFTITATDACNNSSAPTTVIYIWTADTTAPTITSAPSGSNLGCNPASLPTDASVKALVTATDNCTASPTINVSHVDGGTACAPTRTFTITATDSCNNSSAPTTVIYTWTVDTTAPVVTVPVGSNLGCNPASLPTDASVKALVSATDTCSTPVVNVSHIDATSGCVVTRTFTVMATDACGNTSAGQTVIYTWTVDTAAPTVTVPTGSNLGCNPASLPSDASVKALVSATDTCSTPVVNVSHTDATSGCVVTRTFTVTATDACNNASSPQTVVYSWTVDTTAPSVTVPTGSNLGCNPASLPTDASVKALVSATDTCSTPVVNVSHADATSGCLVTRTFTVTATDACNNASSPQTVVYTWTIDTAAPAFAGCTNQLVYQQVTVKTNKCGIWGGFNYTPICSNQWIWFNSALKPCLGVTNKSYTVTITGQTITGDIGGVTVSLAVPDAQITYSSNTTSSTTTFTNNMWVTTCPLGSTLTGNQFGSGLAYKIPFASAGGGNLTWVGNFAVTDGASANWQWAASVYTNLTSSYSSLGVKPCDDATTSSYKNSDAACTPQNYKQHFTCGARSGRYGNYCGNRTFPWVCNRGTSTVCSGGVVQYVPPTASDPCGGVPNVVCVPVPGTGFVTGSTNVTCTAADDCGNTNTCSFTVSLASPPPNIACPGNITTNTSSTSCSQVVKWTATGTSVCGGTVTTTCSPTNGATFAKGTTSVTCKAIETGKGTNSCSFTVTVNDKTVPTITCPATITTNTCNSTAVVTFTPTVSDNCSGVSYSCSPASGSAFARGTNTVTCTATDSSSNTASCSFKVIVTAMAPCAPSSPKATAGTGKVTLTWTASTGSAPITYSVKRSLYSAGPWTTIATGITTLTYTDTAPTKGCYDYYVITATNCAGTSGNSCVVYAKPL